MVNNIKNNTISEILARKNLNALNEIKNAEIKNKRLIPNQKELLDFFNNLVDTILTENENNNNSNNSNSNNNNNENNNNNSNNIIITVIIEGFIPTLAVVNARLP